MGAVKINEGNLVVVDAKKEELIDIGVNSDTTMKWLTNGEPKKVDKIVGKQIYLEDEDSVASSVWVYSAMVYRVN